ncbi:MAG: SdiA-regulated domain-containing protein [Ardenticatenaceae bacterium]|nr:SdiA-regulated domain-containing protein [Ardenticatenaceae bacterium]
MIRLFFRSAVVGSLGILALLGAGCATTAVELPAEQLVNDNWSDSLTQVTFPEPSGIVYHSQRKTLFVVGDEGDLGEITMDGEIVARQRVKPADFEGITYDPATGLLYVIVEGDNQIVEIDPLDLTIQRTFDVDLEFEGQIIPASSKDGLEGITFVPDEFHPEGGFFYLVNQSFDLNLPNSSVLMTVNVPLKSDPAGEQPAKIEKIMALGVVDLAGLYYDSQIDMVYVISDTENKLFRISANGEKVAVLGLPGRDQEGIVRDADGNWYIAQDFGAVIKAHGE